MKKLVLLFIFLIFLHFSKAQVEMLPGGTVFFVSSIELHPIDDYIYQRV